MWKVEWDSKALKEAKKLNRDTRKKIIDYLENRVLKGRRGPNVRILPFKIKLELTSSYSAVFTSFI